VLVISGPAFELTSETRGSIGWGFSIYTEEIHCSYNGGGYYVPKRSVESVDGCKKRDLSREESRQLRLAKREIETVDKVDGIAAGTTTDIYINTPSDLNCVDYQRFDDENAYFECFTYNLYFYPREHHWHTYENTQYELPRGGPRICFSTSALTTVNSPYYFSGVDLRPTSSYILTQTFAVNPGDTTSRVHVYDFDPVNLGITNFREVTAPSSSKRGTPGTGSGTITHVYEIDALAKCDGSTSMRYGGTIAREGFSPSDEMNHGGMEWAIRASIYAGCLGNQFCV